MNLINSIASIILISSVLFDCNIKKHYYMIIYIINIINLKLITRYFCERVAKARIQNYGSTRHCRIFLPAGRNRLRISCFLSCKFQIIPMLNYSNARKSNFR